MLGFEQIVPPNTEEQCTTTSGPATSPRGDRQLQHEPLHQQRHTAATEQAPPLPPGRDRLGWLLATGLVASEARGPWPRAEGAPPARATDFASF